MHAETAYLFRHALLRDAAYALQMPSDRWRLHALALELTEQISGGRPGTTPLVSDLQWLPHPSDAFALELAHHAREAAQHDEGFAPLHRLYLQRAAHFAEGHFRGEEAESLWHELAQLHEGDDRAACLHNVGIQNRYLRRGERAEAALREALKILQETGNERGAGRLLITLGVLCRQLGRNEQSEELQRQAIEIARRFGEARSESIALNNLGTLLRETGRKAEAEQVFTRAIETARAVGDAQHEGSALGNFAGMLSDAGRIDEAERAYERSLSLLRQARDLRAEATIMINQSILYSITGRKPQAERALRDALVILRRVGSYTDEGLALSNLAIICRQGGQFQESEQCFKRAVGILREVGAKFALGPALGEQAVLFRETGRPQLALASAQEAVSLHCATGNRLAEASDGCELALCLLAAGRHDEAARTWAQAAPALQASGFAYALEEKLAAMRETCAKAGVPRSVARGRLPALNLAAMTQQMNDCVFEQQINLHWFGPAGPDFECFLVPLRKLHDVGHDALGSANLLREQRTHRRRKLDRVLIHRWWGRNLNAHGPQQMAPVAVCGRQHVNAKLANGDAVRIRRGFDIRELRGRQRLDHIAEVHRGPCILVHQPTAPAGEPGVGQEFG
jgi:tetratricopeptide (TPR) repeat protein